MPRPRFLFGLLVVLALLAPTRAEAVGLGLEAVADFPVDMSVRLWAELPLRLRASVAVGVLPSFFGGGFDTFTGWSKGWDQSTGQVATNAIKNSFVGRAHVGWRPAAKHGFYFDLGYSIVGWGGNASLASMIEKAFGASSPDSNAMNDPSYNTSTVLHMLDLELGWQWKVVLGLTIRVAGGVSWVFLANSTLSPTTPSSTPSSDTQYVGSVQSALDGKMKNAIIPGLTLALGWQLF